MRPSAAYQRSMSNMSNEINLLIHGQQNESRVNRRRTVRPIDVRHLLAVTVVRHQVAYLETVYNVLENSKKF